MRLNGAGPAGWLRESGSGLPQSKGLRPGWCATGTRRQTSLGGLGACGEGANLGCAGPAGWLRESGSRLPQSKGLRPGGARRVQEDRPLWGGASQRSERRRHPPRQVKSRPNTDTVAVSARRQTSSRGPPGRPGGAIDVMGTWPWMGGRSLTRRQTSSGALGRPRGAIDVRGRLGGTRGTVVKKTDLFGGTREVVGERVAG